MKKTFSIIIWLAIFVLITGTCYAGTYSFDLGDLDDLEHSHYYTWGTDWNTPTGETIISATLSFTNIYNWNTEAHVLYANLLDEIDVGEKAYTDNQNPPVNAFDGQGVALFAWDDLPKKSSPPYGYDRVFTFDTSMVSALNTYAQSGTFGLGFDPDCHFYNDGINFTITTTPVPEPATMILFGTGIASLAGLRLRRKK